MRKASQAFHAHHDGRVIESITSTSFAAARKYFDERYGNGAVKVKGDPTEDEVKAIANARAIKESALVIDARVRSQFYGDGTVIERTPNPNTGLYVTVRYDSGVVKGASSYYLEIISA